jgi:hypothetical protein|nr:MAG TPA: hypothetical protein [Caudoviricetes sp.]
MYLQDTKQEVREIKKIKKKKMKMKDFKAKYWRGGSEPYQYHTIRVKDGENELQQLMINDIRALKDREVVLRKFFVMKGKEKQDQIDALKKDTRILTVAVCVMTGIITVGHIQHFLRKSHSQRFFHRL